MWRRNDGQVERGDAALKESLLRQLSHTVKEVQLHFSKTKETMSTQEGATSLITVLEAMFLHGMKRSLLDSVVGESRPSPSFIKTVTPLTHKDTIAQLGKLKQVSTNVGRSRAWLRLALNEGSMPSYLMALLSSTNFLHSYRPSAFLKDREAMDTACRLLEGLIAIPFNTPVNSSLLNTWNSEPLNLSGTWTSAKKAGVIVGTDALETLEDEENLSSLTASSSMRSLMTLDDTQAIRIILNTPLPTDNLELPRDVEAQVEKKMEELEAERHEIVNQSFSFTEEISELPDDSGVETDRDQITNYPSESTEEEEEEIARPAPRRKSEDEYNRLYRSESCLDRERLRIQEAFTKHEQTFENTIPERPKIDQLILSVPRETGLKAQNFACADCQLSIGLNFAPTVLCHVTGDLLCNNCHKNDVGVVPARIIYNWDHTKYLTGLRAAAYLTSIHTQAIFNIEELNPKIYTAVVDMQDTLRLRKHLHILDMYLTTCKEKQDLPIRSYIYETPHLYSLADLMAVPSGSFKGELEKVFAIARNHVVNCWICKEKGFICELCSDKKVIYPFDDNVVFRCNKCSGVYHGNCLKNKRNCPKCIRRKKRASQTDLLGND